MKVRGRRRRSRLCSTKTTEAGPGGGRRGAFTPASSPTFHQLSGTDSSAADLLLNTRTRTCTRVFSTNPFCQEVKVLKYLLMDRTTFPPASLPCGPAPTPVLANGQAALERWENTVVTMSLLVLVGFYTSPAPSVALMLRPNNANNLGCGPSPTSQPG